MVYALGSKVQSEACKVQGVALRVPPPRDAHAQLAKVL
jgi:hypothetical protein